MQETTLKTIRYIIKKNAHLYIILRALFCKAVNRFATMNNNNNVQSILHHHHAQLSKTDVIFFKILQSFTVMFVIF